MTAKSVLWSMMGILIILAGFNAVPVRAAQTGTGATMVINLAKLVVNPGDNFDVIVQISTDIPSRGAQCELHFDPQLIDVTGITEGSFYKDWAQAHGASTIMLPNHPSVDQQNGDVSMVGVAILAGEPGQGPTGSGMLLTYHVRAKQNVKGDALFSLENIMISDAGNSGVARGIANVKRQNAIVRVGAGPAPLQPSLEDAPTPGLVVPQKSQTPASTLSSPVSISPAAQTALTYQAQKENLSEDTFVITGDYSNEYPYLARKFQMVTLLDKRPNGKIYKLMVDLATGEIVEDIAAVDQAEAKAQVNKYGKFQPDLYEKLQTMQDTDTIDVAIWTVAKPGQSLNDLETEANQALAEKFPQAKVALDRNSKPTDVGDMALSRQIQAEYRGMVNTGMAQRTQPLAQAIQDRGVIPTTLDGAPFLFANLSKKDLLELALRDDVGTIYDAGEKNAVRTGLISAIGSDRIPAVQNQNYDGYGVNVSILDAGNIDFTSPDGSLCPASSHNCFLYPGLVLQGTGEDWHATLTASIVASHNSSYHGVASGVNISSAGVPGLPILDSRVIDALNWSFTTASADVVNVSYGVCSPLSDLSNLDRAFDYYARLDNRLIVGAAGNNINSECPQMDVIKPASGWNVLAVGAYDDLGDPNWVNDQMADFSNYINPPSIDNDHEKPEVVAPGANIDGISINGTYINANGTSLAAPQVTGLAALLIQANPELRDWPEALRAIIMASAVHNIDGPVGIVPGQDLKDGAGAIDGAVAQKMTQLCPPGTAGAPCWWWDAVTPSTSLITHSITVTRGEHVRAAIDWSSNADCQNTYSCNFDWLYTDLDLEVIDPFGNPVAISSSMDNNYELVDFVAPQTGQYNLYITCSDQNAESNFVATAWVKDSTYIDNLRNNVENDGFVSNFQIMNTGSVARNVTINYFDTNDNPIINDFGLDYDTCYLLPTQQCGVSVGDYHRIPNGGTGSAYVDGGEDLFVTQSYSSAPNILYIAGSADIFPIAQISGFRYPGTTPQVQVVAMDSDRGQQALLNGLVDVAMSSTPCSTTNQVVPGSVPPSPSPYHCNQLETAVVGYKDNQLLYMYILPQSIRPKPNNQNYIYWIDSIEAQSIVKDVGDTPIITPTAPVWDVNLDHRCSIGDITAIGNYWGLTAPFSGNMDNPGDPMITGWVRADVNWDGHISIGDVTTVGNYWGQTW